MDVQEIQQLLSGKVFKVLGIDIYYKFNNGTLVKNDAPLAHYELSEDNGKFYLKTIPYIYDNEDLAGFRTTDNISMSLSLNDGFRAS